MQELANKICWDIVYRLSHNENKWLMDDGVRCFVLDYFRVGLGSGPLQYDEVIQQGVINHAEENA